MKRHPASPERFSGSADGTNGVSGIEVEKFVNQVPSHEFADR